MDAEYARQVCALMRWDAGVLIAPPSTPSHGFSSNAANGPNATHPNNAGYAVLSFASARAAAAALAQVSAQMTMPNSARLFMLNWAPPGVGGATSSGSQSSANANANANGGSGPAGSNSGNATSGSGSGSGSDAANPGASDYSGGSGGGGGGGGVVSPTSPLFPLAGTVGATHAGGMGAGGAGFGQQQLQGQGQGQSGVGIGMGMGYQGVGGGGMGVGVGGAMGAMGGMGGMGTAEAAYLKEYSIFVGDLAPETSNSDLVAVSIGGFTDEVDQQRALIEMHGLYCLSRPMRIAPATAKFKPPQADGVSPAGLSTSASAPAMPTSVAVSDQQQQQQQSVSAPIAVPSTASYYPGGGDAVAYAPGGGVMSTSATGGGTGAEYFAQQYGVGVPQQQAQGPVQQQQRE
ncbi:hypothetical protein B0H14DRAFT_3764170 [Mycena olivaceomarginata]|nr:hypothetical protein B0H14DRAFT_3764170 [Mycena olivaceomarginata]